MAIEVARGKQFFPEWNTARWWLSQDAYQRDPARFLANFDAGLGLFASHGIRVIPVLFNRWLDPVCDFGGVPIDHLVPQMSAWNRTADLFADVGGTGREVSPVEQVFTDYLIDVVGCHRDDDRGTAVALTEPLSDVVSFHPYYMWNLDPSRQPLAARGEFRTAPGRVHRHRRGCG